METHLKNTSLLIVFLILVSSAAAQDNQKVDYNTFYRSPLNLGMTYMSYSPLSGYDTGSPYKISDLNMGLQYSIKGLPSVMPELTLGYTISDSQNSINADLWDSSSYYGLAGIRYVHKFSKTFEAGIGLSAGYSRAQYKNLSEEGQAVTGYILAQSGLYLGLNPSFNMNLTLSPTVRYQYCLDDYFNDMNGFLIGLGGTVSFRFGKDPDSPDSAVKSIRFENAEIEPLFAAMQSYYINNPIGTITLENTEKKPLQNIVISFFQPGYMDAPSIVEELETIDGKQTLTVGLTASFNENIFLTEGVTPLNGEVLISYDYNNRPVEQRYSVSYDLYDKSSLIWDDDRKVASFITPADSALQNYSSFIRQSCKDSEIQYISKNLQNGMQIFHALGEIGCIYQVDPLQPFAAVSEQESMTVDTVNLPRNTLKKLTGDCDDLTVLYLSLLETLGIETAFLTVPGHIYTAFNTKESARSYGRIHPDRDMTINIDGELWIPVEITMIGRTSFLEAWKTGAEQWNSLDETPELRMLYPTAEARKIYRPVGLRETDLGLQYGSRELIAGSFSNDLEDLSDVILRDYYAKAEKRGSKLDYNRLGIALADFGQREKAVHAFKSAIQLDPDYLSPRVNLGNLEYLKGDYQNAVQAFQDVLRVFENKGKLLSHGAAIINLNISKTYYAMEEYEQAARYYSVAKNVYPEKAAESAYLASVSSGSAMTRAAEIGNDSIIFMEDEE